MKPYFAMPEDGWYNIAIAGEFPHSTGYVQVLDSEAFKAIVQDIHEQMGKPNWPGILIDFDHGSLDTDKPSTAAGWLTDIEERPDGLWAQIRWSDCGQKSLEGGEFRFVSPVWMLADCEDLGEKRVRPRKLATCAITNAPNIRGMVPLTNRAEEKGVPLSPTGRALPIQERVQVPRAALEAIEKLENRRPLTEKQRKLLWARASGFYGGNGDSNPYQNANKAGRAAAGTPGQESKATTKDILEAKEQARKQSQYMHDYIQRKVKPEVQAKEDEQRRRYSAPEYRPGKKIKKYKDTWSGGKTWEKRNTGSKKYGKKLKKGKPIEKDLDQRRGRREDNAKETLKKSILSLVNRARLAAFLANTSWEDMTDQQRRWWWAQMGGGGSAVNPYTGEAPTSADNPWATEGTPSNPYAQLYGNDMTPEESAFWREVYGNVDNPNWTPSEEFGTTSDVDGLFSPEGWAAHQQLSQDLNQQLRDEYDRIARQEAIDYQNNLPAFTSPSTWDYFSAAVEDFGRGMAYGVGNLIDAIADIPQTTITGIPDLAALIAKGGSWLVGGSGNIAGGLESFAQSVHDLVDPKAQWVKDKTGLSSMIEELGEVWSGSDWAAKTSKISAGVFAAAVDMLVGVGGLAYAKGPEGIVKLGGTLNDATKIELGLVSKEQILARDIREAIRKINIEEMTKNLDAEVLAKFAKEDLDDAVRHLDEALDMNRAMSAQRHMEEVTEIERRMAQANYDRARWAAQEADNAAEMARDAERLAKERAAQEWYDSNILKADREAEAARLANPMADAEARQLARENPANLGAMPEATPKPAGLGDDAARAARVQKAEEEAARRAMESPEEFAKRRAEGWTWDQKHDQAYANQWGMSLEEARGARLERELRDTIKENLAKELNVPLDDVKYGTKYADEINARLGYGGNGKSANFKADDPGLASFAERHPTWEKVTNEDGTVYFQRPTSKSAPTRTNLDDAVSRLNTQTKNEIVGGMYDAASRGGSYSDDAGRLLVDNGTVTPAGERMIKEGAREQMGAGRAATEASSTTARSGLSRETILKDMESAQARGSTYRVDMDSPLVENGKLTARGEAFMAEGTPANPWKKLEEAAESIRRADAAEDAARATASTRPTVGQLSEATERLSGRLPEPATNLQDYIAATERKADILRQWQAGDLDRMATLEAKGTLTEAERIEWGGLKKTARERAQRLEAMEKTLDKARHSSMPQYWDEAVAEGKKADAALEAAFSRIQGGARESARSALEAAQQSQAKAQRVKDAVDTILEPLGRGLEQPSVAKTARAIDALNGGGGNAGKASIGTIAGIGASAAMLGTLGFIGAGDSDGGHDYHVEVPGNKQGANITPMQPDPTLPMDRRYMNVGTETNPQWLDLGTGELTDFNPNVHSDRAPAPPLDERPNGWEGNPNAAKRAAAQAEAARIVEQEQPAAPAIPEATPRPVRPTVEPTQEEIARVREQAGMTSRGTAADLQRAIDQLETERASLEARTYAVPVPEMRPTEYQNIQQVRRTAAAQPGATSTSIIAAVDKAKRQNADVSHLKAELDRAVKGLGSEKQRAKAETEVLRRFNAEYYDAIEKNEANDKIAAKRLQQIIDKLPRLEASKGYALQRAENAEERAESKLRRETQGKADAQYRDELAAWRDSERARREMVKAARQAAREQRQLGYAIKQRNDAEESRFKKTWKAAQRGDKEEFFRLQPDGDWDAAQRMVRQAYDLAKKKLEGYGANPALNIRGKPNQLAYDETGRTSKYWQTNWRVKDVEVPGILYASPIPTRLTNRRLGAAIGALAC